MSALGGEGVAGERRKAGWPSAQTRRTQPKNLLKRIYQFIGALNGFSGLVSPWIPDAFIEGYQLLWH